MKTYSFQLIVTLSMLFLAGCNDSSNQENELFFPEPTKGKTIINEKGEANQGEKELFFEQSRRTTGGVDWREVQKKNRKERLKRVLEQNIDCDNVDSYANGNLEGQWLERGSNNQSGSMGPMAYDPDADIIYSISAGGLLWKGALSGNNWEPIVEHDKYDWRMLLNYPITGGRRLMVLKDQIPTYSDDQGGTWTSSTGTETYYENWGTRKKALVVDDVNSKIAFLIGVWDPVEWGPATCIYWSTDQGTSFTKTHDFGLSDLNNFEIAKTYNGIGCYLIERTDNTIKTYKPNMSTGGFNLLNTTNVPNLGVNHNLFAIKSSGITTLYITTSTEVFRSINEGATWTLQGNLPTDPWAHRPVVSAFNPDHLYYGDINCYKSEDAGATWELVNDWVEYYGSPATLLHADIMGFNFFEKSDGTQFMSVSNHGGINISYDNLETTPSIAQQGLNVSQYYGVSTDPISNIIYAGSQDQGFQRSVDAGGILDFDQVISGDYGIIAFSNGFDHLWTIYPGGWVTYYDDPQNGGFVADWTLESLNEPVWLPQLMESPYNDNSVYLSGGNMNNGQPGAHVIKLTYDGSGIQRSQFPFDFHAASGGGNITAIEVSPFDTDRWYVGTDNGKFFYSNNGGTTFTESTTFTQPDLLTFSGVVLASKLDPNLVYLAGAGITNPPAYKSTNGGATFTPMSNGLPQTAFGAFGSLVANDDESILFAATDDGSFAYIVAEDMWYDLGLACTPTQILTCVEFISEINTVRFGSYSRGIWDFKIGPANNCPTDLTVNTASSNLYEASNSINSNATIVNPQITYHAGNYIDLLPSFSTTLGVQFTADIQNCGTLPIPLIDDSNSELIEEN